MRVITALLIWLAGACASVAQPYPQLYAVTGVAPGDVLNIRAAPQPGADKIGALRADTADVQVVATRDGWAQVNIQEHNGWVSLQYLVAQGPGFDARYEGPLGCYGTEPFWSLHIVPGATARFESPAPDSLTFAAGMPQPAMGYSDRIRLPVGDAGMAIVRRTECSDGMSDNVFGLEVDLILDDGRFVTGCCSVVSGHDPG